MDDFLARFVAWAHEQPDIHSVALVGSWARGDARADSDLDLVAIAAAPDHYENDLNWVRHFGEPASIAREDWGLVQSVRVHYADGPEVEFGWTSGAWLSTNPVDPGTADVISDGVRVLMDRDGRLTALVAAVDVMFDR